MKNEKILKKTFLILGSSSKGRAEIIKKMNFNIDFVISPDINESLLKKNERPRVLSERLCVMKNLAILSNIKKRYSTSISDEFLNKIIDKTAKLMSLSYGVHYYEEKHLNKNRKQIEDNILDVKIEIPDLSSSLNENGKLNILLLTADSVACKGRKILDKALNVEDLRRSAEELSGSSSRLYSSVCISNLKSENFFINTNETRLKIKLLSKKEIDFYVNLEEGIGKAGGYSLEGYFENFVISINGSISAVKGLYSKYVMDCLLSNGLVFNS